MNSIQGSSLIHTFMERQSGATVTKVFQTVGSCLIFDMVSKTGRSSSFLVTLCYWGLEYNETIILNAHEPSENQHIYIRVLEQLKGAKLVYIEFDSDGFEIGFSNGMEFFMILDDVYGPGYDDWVTFFEEGYPAITYSARRGFEEENASKI